MAMVCEICNHIKRLQIDRDLVAGKSQRRIAVRYGLSTGSIKNHSSNHLSRQLVQAYEKKSLTENMDLLARIDLILSRAEDIFQRNYDRRRDLVALKALAETRNTIDMLARISMFLHESRAMELQLKQASFKEEREREEQEFIAKALDRLTPAEAYLWERLLERIHGESDTPIVTDDTAA